MLFLPKSKYKTKRNEPFFEGFIKAEIKKAKGDAGEAEVAWRANMRGMKVIPHNQKIGGYDQIHRPVDMLGRQIGPDRHVEAKWKSSDSITKAQRRQKAADAQWIREDANIENIPGTNFVVESHAITNRFKKKYKK